MQTLAKLGIATEETLRKLETDSQTCNYGLWFIELAMIATDFAEFRVRQLQLSCCLIFGAAHATIITELIYFILRPAP
jgi:hypothetical protein